MTLAESENITKELTSDQRLVLEPGYAAYLRSQGFTIEAIDDIAVVESESNPEKQYLTAVIDTYQYPSDSPELDAVAHRVDVPVCTCWNWRSDHSADLENQQPGESGLCKHLNQMHRTERAKNDEKQGELDV